MLIRARGATLPAHGGTRQFIKVLRQARPAVCPSVCPAAGAKMLRLVGRAVRCWGARRGPTRAPRVSQCPAATPQAR